MFLGRGLMKWPSKKGKLKRNRRFLLKVTNMEATEMKYRELVSVISNAINRGFDVEMICGNGIVSITAGKAPQIQMASGFAAF